MAYETIKCMGYSANSTDDEVTYDVLVEMTRADILEIVRFVKFAAEQSDQFEFIRDCVGMVERWRAVLIDHTERIKDDDDDD